ncbi:hypothetical protein [uncultured Cedecea sp.]|uniref:hypothetical protein n=1 Tax=uncultured Cedecea sp. TaxID=988762 RepID=UPI00261BD59A|nr:hypothetical protein [uncultured Cedecea sp.]
MNAVNEYFVELEYENREDVTKEQLREALVKNSYIHIKVYNGHWPPNIYIPDEVPLAGGIIYITSNATFDSKVYVYDEAYTLSGTSELIVLGSPTKQWVVASPASPLAVNNDLKHN